MVLHLFLPFVFFFSLLLVKTGAVLDVTLVSLGTRATDFSLRCVTGERDMHGSDLHIRRDNSIVRTTPKTQFKIASGSNDVRAHGFVINELVGVLICTGKGPAEQTEILYVNNFPNADLIPVKVTVTVSVNSDVTLEAKINRHELADILWKYNGTMFHTTYKGEVTDKTAQLNMQAVKVSHAGIYSAGFMGASPLNNAFFRLIVRGCPDNKWGPSCQKDCRECLNGGICHDSSGECICAPGFMGTRCEKACREGNFGRNCQEMCKGEHGCRGRTFCLPDPYGCSCGSGWTGSHCQKSCPPEKYGANCALHCQCKNGGSCNSFSGCLCPSGWHGQHCEKSDRIPKIIDLPNAVEFNLNSTAVLTCASSGNPQPSRESIELRRPDGSVLAASKAVLDRERSTCEFTVQSLTLTDNGLWECRVFTTGGQDSRKFQVYVKVPPKPIEPPLLLDRQSQQLTLAPLRTFYGDGPIKSIKLLYKSRDSDSPWEHIIVKQKENITLQKLKPVTTYLIQAQLSRPGPGGEGPLGPLAVMETDCQEIGSQPPSMESRNPRPSGSGHQLILAIIGSVSITCFTIILALLALFCIKKNFFHRRRMFTYQSGSGEETILQFSSGTLTLSRHPRPQIEPFSYPVLVWEDIKFEDVIGEGNFGQVIKAMIKKDGQKMNAAVKMLKEFASENDHRDFAGELEVLCKLGHHPNVINLLGACENRGYLYIATEYAPYGNLLDFLRKSRVLETDPVFAKEHRTASTLTSQQLLQFASDVAKGMQYLSEKQFIHRDLAARNVLVGENLVTKIADFGLSRGEEVYVKKTMGRLPVRWMAIESLNYSVYTTKSDVWSFGVLLWEIVSLGGTPYCGMTCAELYENLPQGYRMEKPRNCDDEVYELMKQCWRDRPYERPTFSQISIHITRMLDARKAYVNMALFENFTYAGIDATAEE
ncbi:tyrosine-protein kinase receptor Tie-1 isoform X3 [Xenopus laevis]|uniref:Tyrosine-protein kinase receptor Tie-1 n=1 Tax=Xenopus laevis TaxID=8355 RepID=A0A8J1MYK7_XENLA|nr:tyrosine-protein kinase receptor Tie-1 isoform X3 [Xenopus laevis]